MQIRALFFDVFGTLVDWRPAIMHACREAYGPTLSEQDAFALADAWRRQYFLAIESVRDGKKSWRPLEILLAEILPAALDGFKLPPLDSGREEQLVSAWNRLDPWPDCVEGLTRLRRLFVLAPASNASFWQTVSISRHAGFIWDVVLGAQLAQNFKTHPSVYAESVAALGLKPSECLMVAAHNADLNGARAVGLRTAFVVRPTEFGAAQQTDLVADPRCDYRATNLLELADALEATFDTELGLRVQTVSKDALTPSRTAG